MILLDVQNISKSFIGINALQNFSFCVNKNQIVGIIGPNGAGKTTAFNVISGIYPTEDNGQIIFDGVHLERKKQHEIALCGLARTFQNIRLFTGMNVIENVMTAGDSIHKYSFISSLLNLSAKKKVERENVAKSYQLLELLGIQKYALNKVEGLPYGVQRKVEVARALALKPKLIMLDEPAAGLNPNEVCEFNQIIKYIKDKFNIAILIIEHHMDVIMEICDYIYVLNYGRPLAEGTPEQIKTNQEVINAYIGEEEK